MKETTGLLLASSVEALIYKINQKAYQLVETLSHQSGRLKSADLVSDKPGHYKTSHKTRGAFASPSDPHEHEHRIFAAQVADYLNQAVMVHQYQHLIVCAEPHFYGLLHQALSTESKQCIKKSIQKNYIPLPEPKRNQVIESIIYDQSILFPFEDAGS